MLHWNVRNSEFGCWKMCFHIPTSIFAAAHVLSSQILLKVGLFCTFTCACPPLWIFTSRPSIAHTPDKYKCRVLNGRAKWKMRLLAFEWARNRTVRVNSLEVTELESCNFDCTFKRLFFYSTPGSERVNPVTTEEKCLKKQLIHKFCCVKIEIEKNRKKRTLKSGPDFFF